MTTGGRAEPRNPVHLLSPGERGVVELGRGIRAHIVHGATPGPVVWAWVPRGDGDPSLAQALGELRDCLAPRTLHGAVGLLLDGPAPPIEHEHHPEAPILRAISSGAEAVVLLSSLPPGFAAAPHVALDVSDRAARKVAGALGIQFLAPPIWTPRLDRRILLAPVLTLIDGEYERIARPVIDRARNALLRLLGRLKMTGTRPPAGAPLRVVVKKIVEVEGPSGLVEPTVAPGDLVHEGAQVAWVGEPGGTVRQALYAPTDGVVLYLRSGRLLGGPIVGIGRLQRTLPKIRRRQQKSAELIDIGWCEKVGLPLLGVAALKAKIDTGARTSALHVVEMTRVGATAEGHDVLSIEIPAGRNRTRSARVIVADYTRIRDSGGHTEWRPVIETSIRLGPVEKIVRISLTDRGDMIFPMLVGRTALGGEFRIHPTRRFLLGGEH
jgi:hypothetical protein